MALRPPTRVSRVRKPSAIAHTDAQPQSRPESRLGNPVDVRNDPDSTNIRVVARCRGRNDREIKAKSAVVVETGHSSNEIAVRVGQDLSTKKIYNLDHVFGPESDQNMIFDEVVSPIVDELLTGINCTVFAYGQTGTGKTFTMTGDDSIDNGTFSADAGIIPRVIYKLFAAIDTKGRDCCVSFSCVELYNEELSDLLEDDDKKLRIIDDSAKRTVTIQGLSDYQVTTPEAGMKLLQTAVRRRHIASTKMNDISSRSHTIFTITVAMDDGTGEYAHRSKINLVDLAGSENIGKSGAENKRAREAGMINQSLLALGRVINGLVDKTAHIPYRESKLTRLLQDSLGGHTKTCIIATVSPALVNVEETLSTLEYASRAKNIKNKPQVSGTIPKRVLLKEYAEDLERMRQDLTATRKKNGVYLVPEQYNEMIAESESQKILVNDQQRKLETVDKQLKDARELIERTRVQLTGVNRQLESASGDLSSSLNGVMISKVALQSSRHVVNDLMAHAQGMETSIGKGLLDAMDVTIRDVNSLQDRLQERLAQDDAVKSTVSESCKGISGSKNQIETYLGNYSSVHDEMTLELSGRLNQVVAEEVSQINKASNLVREKLEQLGTLNHQLAERATDSEAQFDQKFGLMDTARKEVEQKVQEELEKLQDAAAGISQSIQKEVSVFRQRFKGPVHEVKRTLEILFNQMTQELERNKVHFESFSSSLNSSVGEVVRKQQTQQDELEKAIKEERQRAAVEKDKLVSQMSLLIKQFTDNYESRVESSIDKFVRKPTAALADDISSVTKTCDDGLASAVQRNDSMSHQMVQNQAAIDSKLGGILSVAESGANSLEQSASRVAVLTNDAIASQMAIVQNCVSGLYQHLSQVRSHGSEHNDLVKQQIAKLTLTCEKQLNEVQDHMTFMKNRIEGGIDDEIGMNKLTEKWEETKSLAQSELTSISRTVAKLEQLASDGTETGTEKQKPTNPATRVPLDQIPENLPRMKPALEDESRKRPAPEPLMMTSKRRR